MYRWQMVAEHVGRGARRRQEVRAPGLPVRFQSGSSQGEQVRAEESRMSAVERSGMSLSRAGAAAGERMG